MKQEYEKVFCDVHESLDLQRAKIEASRCYYCYDAPCIQACPTQIDIPSFIRKIGNENIRGAALDILSANIMGGTCARACPVETLCQQACVREASEQKPVEIGKLQRFATDKFFATGEQPFKRAPATGHRVAVVGAGPAGLSCAHKLATLGHEVTVFEAKAKSGGLNEYGLAPYKVAGGSVPKEIDFILGVGGIEVRHGQALGRDFTIEDLRAKHAAVFLGVGLGDVNALGVPGEELAGVIDAVKQIEQIRQAKSAPKGLASLAVGRHVVVIGGGNTAVDIAIQMKRLGAEFVTLVYRRGEAKMSATHHEQQLAQTSGVLIKTWARPHQLIGDGGKVTAIELEYTETSGDGKLKGTGKFLTLPADQVFKAIGQKFDPAPVSTDKATPKVAAGKLAVNDRFETSVAGVYAGGDCIALGEDLTVTSVQQGKLAALAIHKSLSGGNAAGKRGANG